MKRRFKLTYGRKFYWIAGDKIIKDVWLDTMLQKMVHSRGVIFSSRKNAEKAVKG